MNDATKHDERTTDPLVSIIVITYNSSKYVLETLESAKAQTYQNVELIISDDCSRDDTVEVCKKWLEKNSDRFVRTELITTPQNTGIPKNCNRGLYAAKGEWVKPIAGDDALYEDCIEKNIQFIRTNPECNFCFSNCTAYKESFEKKNRSYHNIDSYTDLSIKLSKLSSRHQVYVLARVSHVNAVTPFINRQKLLDIGGYDESSRFFEDLTTFYNWVASGNHINFFPDETVKYRLHKKSISNARTKPYTQLTVNVNKVIAEKFLHYFTFGEKILFYLESAYLKYYENKKKIGPFGKIIRKIGYVFFVLSVNRRYQMAKKYFEL